ncbi:A/G-specific adenine glycosylase [Arcanobacterium wilhelmae]|uniref:Adenine DNA glycosylase n=1 Tax=Arcanobacterium wilhelmae TaxID=1803177 RepID=A0ABT9NAP1_9ACTO|nr:A/G-specific adenine glycosylase [Arcanobacterium wilhelmae]MDP9800583.1 A/G-specific adenine glycosylase [Arcanobacterium wilhelmae]
MIDRYSMLLQWFEENGRDLPWRRTRDPWAILVCEVMSHQTPLQRVEPIWNAWMHRWPTPHALAEASSAEILVAWDRLGYPSRALRLAQCAEVIVRDFDGELPRSRSELLSLPGVGPYTADAVIAFAFHERSVVLDTNIRRVLARWDGAALPPPSQTKAELARADAAVPAEPERAWRWNMAIMEFGELVCTARNPACEACPLAADCGWFAAGRPADEHAHKRKTQAWKGTNRQARGAIMGVLRKAPDGVAAAELERASGIEPERYQVALEGLIADSLVERHGSNIRLPQ